jgi:hypothetical protein
VRVYVFGWNLLVSFDESKRRQIISSDGQKNVKAEDDDIR